MTDAKLCENIIDANDLRKSEVYMKDKIHPSFRDVAFKDSTTQDIFIIGSTIETSKTIVLNEIEYPLVTMDVTSASHPYFTGKQKIAQAEGRVNRFNRRYGYTSDNESK